MMKSDWFALRKQIKELRWADGDFPQPNYTGRYTWVCSTGQSIMKLRCHLVGRNASLSLALLGEVIKV